MSAQNAEEAQSPSVNDDLAAYVRFHGANDVIDAVLTVALSIYGDRETAIEKCHETFLRRAANLRTSPATRDAAP